MIQAKCIDKIRNKYGVIEKYTLQDKTGDTITVTSKQLKDAINAGKIEIVNLQLTANGRLMDKNIEDTLKSYNIMDKDNENSKNQYNKTIMLGVAPVLNETKSVVGINGKRVVFTDETCKFARNIIEEDAVATFNGSKELTKAMTYMGIRLVFKEAIINNPCLTANIGNGEDYNICILAEHILINHKYVDIKTVDEIFRILKNQHNAGTASKLFKITINLENTNLSKELIFDRVSKILKRQKPSSKSDRRAYDLMIYLEFLYSMWLTTGKSDERYAELAKPYLKEMNSLSRYLDYNTHAITFNSIKDAHLNTITADMGLN